MATGANTAEVYGFVGYLTSIVAYGAHGSLAMPSLKRKRIAMHRVVTSFALHMQGSTCCGRSCQKKRSTGVG